MGSAGAATPPFTIPVPCTWTDDAPPACVPSGQYGLTQIRHALMRTAIRVRAALRHAPVGRLSRRFAESVPGTCAFGTIWAQVSVTLAGIAHQKTFHDHAKEMLK